MENATLHIIEDGTPKSAEFDDFYYSNGQGIAETEFVFIDQNNLSERFSTLKKDQNFTIAETGFGTGLNFLVAWRSFLACAPENARLTFVSCEKYPIAIDSLSQIFENWPSLSSLSDQLKQQYPPALEGFHLLEFGQINLLLMLGDASNCYEQLSANVDAWFLDGFSPNRNPDMWQPTLFQQIKRLSHASTTLATFTAARVVRDGLEGAGFTLQRSSGFGKKRHKMRGDFIGLCGPNVITGWPSSQMPLAKPVAGKNVAIIGAGINGVLSAIELKKRGFNVTIFERAEKLAAGGSGNKQGAVYAKLSAKVNPSTQFYAQALIVAQRVLATLPSQVPHQACGLVQLVHNPTELKRLEEMARSSFIPNTLAQTKNAAQLSELLCVEVTSRGVWFPAGGWLSPAILIEVLVQQYQIPVKLNTEIVSLTEHDNQWTLTDRNRQNHSFDQVILTTASDTLRFTQTDHLPLTPIAGQVSHLATDDSIGRLKAVICTDRYVMPSHNNETIIGSTFRLKTNATDIREQDHQENVESLRNRLPSFLNQAPKVIGGRAGVRCTSPDYLPLVGPISAPQPLTEQFTIPLQRNRAYKESPATHYPGLWVNVAHGSKGLCSSHLCAKFLAALMNDEPAPIQKELINKLNPNRFVVKAMIKSKREKRKGVTAR